MRTLRMAVVCGAGCFISLSAASAQVQSYEVTKTLYFSQDAVNTQPSAVAASRFTARLIAADGDAYSSASFLVPPIFTPVALTDSLDLGDYRYTSGFFATKQDMDDTFANGTYRFQTTPGNSAAGFGDVDLENDYYPTPGYLTGTSLIDLQNMDPDDELTLNINGFNTSPLANVNAIHINIYDENFNSVYDDPFLNPSTFEIIIPPHTLDPSKDYIFEIVHSAQHREVDAGFFTASSYAGFESRTQTGFHTIPEPATLGLLAGMTALAMRRRV